MKRVFVCIVVLALALGLVGCKSIGDKIGEEVGEEIVGGALGGDVEVDGDSVTLETDDGAITVEGDTGNIPEDFPAEFPLYDGLEVDSSSSISGDTDTSFYMNLLSADETADIYDWYKSEFEDGGWDITGDVNVSDDSGDTAMLTVEKGKMQGTLTISPEGDGTAVGIILVVTK